MTVSTIKMTARQFLELGEDPPGVHLELVDGEVAVSPSPTPLHSYVVMRLGAMLTDHVSVVGSASCSAMSTPCWAGSMCAVPICCTSNWRGSTS
jgi:hypothetical protein